MAKSEIVLRTVDHPEANGRVPKRGEQGWTLTFPLDSGTSLLVKCGEQTVNKFREFLGQYALDTMEDAEARTRPLEWLNKSPAEWVTVEGWRISSAFSGENFFVKEPAGKFNGPHSTLELAKVAAEERRAAVALPEAER